MATKCVGPGRFMRRNGGGDSLGSSPAAKMVYLHVAKAIEDQYYAQRAAETEQRRRDRLRPRKDSRCASQAIIQKAGYVLWLHEKEFRRVTIMDVLDVSYSFINNVVMCGAYKGAVALTPPDEIIAAAIAADS